MSIVTRFAPSPTAELHLGHARAEGRPHAWRLDTARALATPPGGLTFKEHGEIVACASAAFGAVVLARKGAPASYQPASYHLCATHDDAAQDVTSVTRGADLLAATHLHLKRWSAAVLP